MNNIAPAQDVFSAYREAKNAFDDACRAYQQAAEIRAQAEKNLHDLTQRCMEVLQSGVYDPTVPQPTQLSQQNQLQESSEKAYGLGGSPLRKW